MHRRLMLSALATPAAIAAMTVAMPALAGTSSPRAHTASRCFTVHHPHRVRECLIRGPRGPQGPRGATGPRGFQGLKGSTGKTGSAGKTGATGPQGTPGPAGVGGRAYAVVNPAAVSATASSAGLVQNAGFTSVRSPATGVYCLTPAAGVDPTHEPAAVSGESSYSASGVVPIATLTAQHSSPCSAAEFEVTTYNAAAPSAPAGAVAFAIVAP
ncbi:MAG TPA: hypothetical protein VID48_13615 [Solirubrobacteraceae bacterium]|jgi:hypothetical protein